MQMKKTWLTFALALLTGAGIVSCTAPKGVSSEKLLGEWEVVEMNGQSVAPSAETPYLGFQAERLYGFTGCNSLTGTVETAALEKGNIDFLKLGSTLMACPDDKYERNFMDALHEAAHVRMSDGSLLLTDASGNVKVRLQPRKFTAENLQGEWEVVELNGKKVVPGDNTPFIGFDTEEKRIYGFTGCNRLTGTLNVERFVGGEPDFSAIGTTRMACQDDIYESAFLAALGKAKKVSLNAARMELQNESGKVLARLDKR